MCKTNFIAILLFIGLSSNAQFTKNNSSFSKGLDAADYSFNVGTAVGTSFDDSYYFTNYFSPSVALDVSKKISIVAGIGVKYTQLNNINRLDNEYNLQKTNANITSLYGYAAGIYKLNDKVNLNATVLFDENMIMLDDTPMLLRKQYKDVSLGINYNITRNFSVNAQMHISDRPYNHFNSHYSGFGAISPFGNSPIF